MFLTFTHQQEYEQKVAEVGTRSAQRVRHDTHAPVECQFLRKYESKGRRVRRPRSNPAGATSTGGAQDLDGNQGHLDADYFVTPL